MKILLVGSGGREHALGWKLNSSPMTEKLYYWPGSAPMELIGEKLDLPNDADWKSVIQKAKDNNINFIVAGPELPLAEGLANLGEKMGIPVFGPIKEAAQLESSKSFAKEIMQTADIPTASFKVVTNQEDCEQEAYQMLNKKGGVVLKADGLAAGKGVFVCKDKKDLDDAIKRLYQTGLQKAADRIVLEEVLEGRECSFFTFLGEGGATTLDFAVDFKRLKDNDLGPNTGGMGCYTPVPWLPKNAADIVNEQVVNPLIQELKKRGITYTGCLYVGLMWGKEGPKVVEFNVRLGDPEAQVLARHDRRDWVALIANKLGLLTDSDCFTKDPDDYPHRSVAIVIASAGYPYGENEQPPAPVSKDIFKNLESDVSVFGASVKAYNDKEYISGTGRVLTVCASSSSFQEARKLAYSKVAAITNSLNEAQFRLDIGAKVTSH